MSQRRSILESVPKLDTSDFTPKGAADNSAPKPEAIRAVAESVNFPSREVTPKVEERSATPTRRMPRLYRSGRNVQFAVKATPEVIDAFYAIADRKNWLLAVTFEKAIAALQREIDREDGKAAP